MKDVIEHQRNFALVNHQRLHYLSAGEENAETVVLLAGFPQSSFAWRFVIPRLAEKFHVIAVDLPGQGDSDLPVNGYDTETVAQLIVALLQQLNITRFNLVGHDIGAWVAFPLAAQFPDKVIKLALLDAGIPGITLPDALPIAPDKAWKTWHFAFHIVSDLPEMLISGRESIYLDWFLKRKAKNPDIFDEKVMAEYLRIFCRPGALRAALAFYRSLAQSAEQNRARLKEGKLTVPLLSVSADQGSIPDMATPLRAFASQVESLTIANSGHFIPEEQPSLLADALQIFFTA
ncbi:alpha/beta fold hydrolase [Mixta mediterraneensis]|uniref:alpha/beta fold hydrolase n=1 Tax=Mixta mediterraneensis TaxID=2758443 RepID=UPI001875095C|nr:alpha/beta hydrolase [Mixta mediterraneensis]MBE5253786.1 alpha/beta hydrolase [Mixta mediterraneensis]